MESNEVELCDEVRVLLEDHLGRLTPERLAEPQTLHEMSQLLAPLMRSMARSWAIVNPAFDDDAFYTISNLWAEHGAALQAHSAALEASDGF